MVTSTDPFGDDLGHANDAHVIAVLASAVTTPRTARTCSDERAMPIGAITTKALDTWYDESRRYDYSQEMS